MRRRQRLRAHPACLYYRNPALRGTPAETLRGAAVGVVAVTVALGAVWLLYR